MAEASAGADCGPRAAQMTGRRLIYAALVSATIGFCLWLGALTLAPGGFGFVDYSLLALLAITLPWSVIGFWNATIGFCVMRFASDPIAAVTPFATVEGDEPIAASTAILSCIRNEDAARIVRNLQPLVEGLVAGGQGRHFHLYILSDSSEPTAIASEQNEFVALGARLSGRIGFTYRRRDINAGYKAGNIADFCERHGGQHDFALVLDADSFMSADAVLRLVRMMQADPKLGILQSLVVGLPSSSAFARLFQFGMRLGMRSYTTGAAWWQGDCGPYWGHNALIRLKPFIAHCHLPPLPTNGLFGGELLSHDQIEAVLMRRAGYEVRVLVREDQSFEQNPPTLIEFVRRDLRWCQGNMQYWHLLRLPGLKAVSRYQLFFALLMFIGSPAWLLLLLLGSAMVAFAAQASDVVRADTGVALFAILLAMWFSPKITTAIDILTRADARRAFGGAPRFIAGAIVEAFFSTLLIPIQWASHTFFFSRLVRGKSIGWIGQTRDDHSVPWSVASRQFWPHTLFGGGCLAALLATHPEAAFYAFFLAGGPALSIPLTVASASPRLGRMFVRIGLGRLPEETTPLPALAELALPALQKAVPATRPSAA